MGNKASKKQTPQQIIIAASCYELDEFWKSDIFSGMPVVNYSPNSNFNTEVPLKFTHVYFGGRFDFAFAYSYQKNCNVRALLFVFNVASNNDFFAVNLEKMHAQLGFFSSVFKDLHDRVYAMPCAFVGVTQDATQQRGMSLQQFASELALEKFPFSKTCVTFDIQEAMQFFKQHGVQVSASTWSIEHVP